MHQTNQTLTLSEWCKRVIREVLGHGDYTAWVPYLRPIYEAGKTVKQGARYVEENFD